jgi:hypothetical protein
MTHHRILIPIVALSLVVGCTTKNGPGTGTNSADAGAATGSNGGGTSGGTSGGDTSATQAFIGSWSPTTGNQTVNCPGSMPSSQAVTDTLTFTSPGGGTTLEVASQDCVFTALASGNTASESPANQTCVVTYQNTDVVLTYSSYTFTLSIDPAEATLSGQGTLKGTVNGTAYNCTFTESAQYLKN